ncbi:glycosyltransferase [candidate division KSB1 bacterium]|nr:glycosyltransferase [candidate division KSB1 bacterium]
MHTICICTTVHQPWDGRIFEKEIKTLLLHFKVIYVAPEHHPYKEPLPENLNYRPLKKPRNRLLRFFRLALVFKQLFALRNDVISYHVHDPELTLVLALLKLTTGKRCFYDIHENSIAAIRDRFWIPAPLRAAFALTFQLIEKLCLPLFDALICASVEIGELYKNKNTIILENLPSRTFYESIPNYDYKKPIILFAGALTKVRGIVQTVRAFIDANLPEEFQLLLLGWFESGELEREIIDMLTNSPKRDRFTHHPFVPYYESVRYIQESTIGIIPYLDYTNHRYGFPNKIFEFMASQTAIIYNNLPNYRRVLADHDIGLCVDSSNIDNLSRAMETLAHDPELRKRLGQNGRALFLEKFNWQHQAQLLVNLYKK